MGACRVVGPRMDAVEVPSDRNGKQLQIGLDMAAGLKPQPLVARKLLGLDLRRASSESSFDACLSCDDFGTKPEEEKKSLE